jgi:proliferating cell nuclear antigen
MISNQGQNSVEFRTVQSNAIRILIESLKNILSDVNIQISPDGIKILAMDGAKVAVVHLKLDSQQFEYFDCSIPVKIGINMLSLHKILKSVKNNDIITFYIKRESSSELNVKIENKDKKTVIISVLKLLDINDPIFDVPNIEFESVITMPSNDFQSYISDLAIISNILFIESTETEFILSAEGDFASQNIIIGETNNGLIVSKRSVEKGEFNIKYLQLFTKSTNLCTTVEIYLKSKFPLILVYNVANLGKLKYCLAPKA